MFKNWQRCIEEEERKKKEKKEGKRERVRAKGRRRERLVFLLFREKESGSLSFADRGERE